MFRNNKKYNELVLQNIKYPYLKAEELVHRSFASIVIEQKEKYIVAKLAYGKTQNGLPVFYDRTFTLNFEYHEKRIFESDILFFDFYIYEQNEGKYTKLYLPGTILNNNDIENSFLLFYKPSSDKRDRTLEYFELSIYHNLEKKCELHNVKRIEPLSLYRYCIPYSVCVHKKYVGRREEKRVLIDWKEKIIDEMKLSLVDWEQLFSVSKNEDCKPSNMFDKSNSISIEPETPSWRSDYLAMWTCPLGHKWKSTIKSITENYVYRNICPQCGKYRTLSLMPYLDDENAKREITSVKKLVEEYGTNDLDLIKNDAKSKLLEALSFLDDSNSDYWADRQILPPFVHYYFAYPNGKAGDIDICICKENGEISNIEDGLYKATLSTKNKDRFLLLNSGIIPQDIEEIVNKKEGEIEARKIIENTEFREFMETNNIYCRAQILSSKLMVLTDELMRLFENNEKVKNERKKIQNEMNRVYENMVFEGKASSKWMSEQVLYRIVRRLFADARFQYRAEWLGKQSLDIYIPSIRVGIEYQGEQHYSEIDFFGGEEGLIHRKELDKKKKLLCKRNSVTLIEWMYIEPITNDNVAKVLSKWMPNQ